MRCASAAASAAAGDDVTRGEDGVEVSAKTSFHQTADRAANNNMWRSRPTSVAEFAIAASKRRATPSVMATAPHRETAFAGAPAFARCGGRGD